MFYIIECENLTEGEKGQYLVEGNEECFLVSQIENATVFNRKNMEGILYDYQKHNGFNTLDGEMKIERIHELGIGNKQVFEEFIKSENLVISYGVGDIIKIGDDFRTVERVEEGQAVVTDVDGSEFSLSFGQFELIHTAEEYMNMKSVW